MATWIACGKTEPVEPIAQVPDKAVSFAHHLGTGDRLKAPHTSCPAREMVVVSFNPLLLHLPRHVVDLGKDQGERGRGDGSLVDGHDVWHNLCAFNGSRQESFGCFRVPGTTDMHIDDLAILVDGTEGRAPPTRDPKTGLVNAPGSTNTMSMRSGRVSVERSEVVHPVVDGRRIDMNAALGQEFRDVSVRQAEAQIPTHGEGNDVVGEAIAAEGRGGAVRLPSTTCCALVHLPARAVPAGLDELLPRTPLTPHAALPLSPHQATAYPISAGPNDTATTAASASNWRMPAIGVRRSGSSRACARPISMWRAACGDAGGAAR